MQGVKQDNPGLVPQIIKDEIWYTLIALKLLKSEFSKDAKCFELAEKKARDTLKSRLKFAANIDEILNKLKVDYQSYYNNPFGPN